MPTHFSLSRQLSDRRLSRHAAVQHVAPSKPFLSTSKQKGAELEKTVENFLPSGLKLAKLRQLAAQEKIMKGMKFKFQHETEAGHRVEGKEGLIKLDTDILKAEEEAIHLLGKHDPRTFDIRKEEGHQGRSAKVLVKGLYHDAAEKAKDAVKPSLADRRRAHNEAVNEILSQGRQQPATPATSVHPTGSAPLANMAEPTPLATNTPTRASSKSPVSGGGRITQAAASDESSISAVTIGVPVAVSAEASHRVTPTIEPVTPLEPTNVITEPSLSLVEPHIQASESSTPAPAAPSVELPDMSHLSDPFGGED